MKSVAANPSSTRTNSFPPHHGSRRSSIAIEPSPRKLSDATRAVDRQRAEQGERDEHERRERGDEPGREERDRGLVAERGEVVDPGQAHHPDPGVRVGGTPMGALMRTRPLGSRHRPSRESASVPGRPDRRVGHEMLIGKDPGGVRHLRPCPCRRNTLAQPRIRMLVHRGIVAAAENDRACSLRLPYGRIRTSSLRKEEVASTRSSRSARAPRRRCTRDHGGRRRPAAVS